MLYLLPCPTRRGKRYSMTPWDWPRFGNYACDRGTPMITPTQLHARSLDEPGAGIPRAGICEGAVGKPALLPGWTFTFLARNADDMWLLQKGTYEIGRASCRERG